MINFLDHLWGQRVPSRSSTTSALFDDASRCNQVAFDFTPCRAFHSLQAFRDSSWYLCEFATTKQVTIHLRARSVNTNLFHISGQVPPMRASDRRDSDASSFTVLPAFMGNSLSLGRGSELRQIPVRDRYAVKLFNNGE